MKLNDTQEEKDLGNVKFSLQQEFLTHCSLNNYHGFGWMLSIAPKNLDQI